MLKPPNDSFEASVFWNYRLTKVRRPENQVLSGGAKSAFYFFITELIVQ